MLKRFIVCAGIMAIAGATVASGASLYMIPPLAGDTATTPNAITPDGAYVVGLSGTRGFLYPVGGAASINVLSSDGAQSTTANGIGYRTQAGQQQLIISGLSSGYVTEYMTTDGGATFGVKRRNTSYTNNTVQGRNQLGSAGNTDAYFVTSRNSGSTALDINRGTGPWPATIVTGPKGMATGDTGRMDAIGATGSAVGSRVNSSIRKNYRMDFNHATPTATPAAYYFRGLSTTNLEQGEALDISEDGLAVAGWSPVGASTTNSNAYKAQFSFSGTSYSWVRTDMLPETGLETGSTTRTVAYAISPDGRYLAGGSYQGVWHAMLWDTADPDPSKWTYLDLWNFAQAKGIMDGFTRLERVWSVGLQPGTGYPVVTGTGVWSPDGGATTYSRGFVMVVPEPATVGLLLLGLPLLRRRR